MIDGVVSGAQSLSTVRMPYDGADPWPRAALEIGGALLLALSAQLACWPRGGGARGYPFLSLVGLLVLVVSPVVSLGGTRPLLLGAAIAALTICFLWLERLPLRPGLGVAALLGVALAGALPLAAVADRGEPWFDYKSFAEGLGPDDPIRFSWNQDYGPIDWPRDGNEVMRVTSDEPHYWKAANLSSFDGTAWNEQEPDERAADFDEELREDWRNKPGWRDRIEVSIRRMRTLDVIAPGTTMEVEDATRPLRPSGVPGRWTASSELRRGDSYTAEVYDPEPTAGELRQANRTGFRIGRTDQLEITVPYLFGRQPTERSVGGVTDRPVDEAVVHFRPFGEDDVGYVTYPQVRRTRYDALESTFRRSPYERTWELAKGFRATAETPFEYILLVNNYLRGGEFGYSERPQQPPAGRAPLDAFLIDSKEGYCQHFSGAMALLLRMGGIPARVATGFSAGGFSKRHDAWIVRDTDAHAWVEAWFDELGWVTFDPTPDATPARSQIAALEAAPAPIPTSPTGSDAAGGGGATQQSGVLRPNLLFDPLRNSPATPPGGQGTGRNWWAWALTGLAALLLALGLVRWLRARRRRGELSPLDRSVAELEAALRRAGRPLPTGTTLRQLEQRLGLSPDATAYLRALSASRYGPAPTLPTAAQRKALRRALAQGLGPIGRLRALWALPPWPR